MGDIYITYEYWFAAFQLALAMLGMGATLTISDFKDVVREPYAVCIGILMQLALVPLLAYLFIVIFGLIGGIAVGIALIASIPGGTTSNIFTYMARGNIPLSISITGLTTIACLITTPLILGILISDYLPSDFTMPTKQIVSDIAATLVLPLFVGMLFLKVLPQHATWVSKWSIRGSLFGLLMIVIGSLSAGRLNIDIFGIQNVMLVFLFIAVLFVIGWLTLLVLKLKRADCTAIEMEVIVRNVNLAVLIKASMFPVVVGGDNLIGDMVLFTILLYGSLQMLLAALLIMRRRNAN